jgi:hypothetical protein
MLNFRYWHALPDGHTLLVTAITPDWVPAAADVLTDSFAETLSAAVYRNYLRRQIKAYLEQHMRLPPKAVVLVALLVPPAPQQPQQAVVEEGQEQQEGEGAAPGSSGESSSREVPNSSATSSSDSSSSSMGGLVEDQQQQQQQSGSESEGELELASSFLKNPLFSTFATLTATSSSGGDEAVAPGADAQEAASEAGPPGAPPASSGTVLVGVVELSFSASTRTQYFSLNPPEVSHPASTIAHSALPETPPRPDSWRCCSGLPCTCLPTHSTHNNPVCRLLGCPPCSAAGPLLPVQHGHPPRPPGAGVWPGGDARRGAAGGAAGGV